MKSKGLVSFNVTEALHSLHLILSDIENNPEYDDFDLKFDLEHAYNHLNLAWNARDASDEAWRDNKNFAKWSKFPIGEIEEYE
jgi:hypothetical protein